MGPIDPPKVLVMIKSHFINWKGHTKKEGGIKQKKIPISKARERQMLTIIIQLHYQYKVLTIVIKLDMKSKGVV
jgi:hypothetical protein